jgi:hypothetical protein
MSKVATIILNRNLPEVTDKLYDFIKLSNGDLTDIFIVEAGSDSAKLSKNTTWHANWESAQLNGLRYPQGMNYALLNLYNEGKFENYDAFFLITNDTILDINFSLNKLLFFFEKYNRLGLISPCSKDWPEKQFINNGIKFFWSIQSHAFLMRRKFIEDLMAKENLTHMNFLFDGNNFRGYYSDVEIIIKGYVNDWAAGITDKVWVEEDTDLLFQKNHLIKTETFDDNLKLCLSEGKKWMREKYGFKSKWAMNQYAILFYEQFFKYYPEFKKFK